VIYVKTYDDEVCVEVSGTIEELIKEYDSLTTMIQIKCPDFIYHLIKFKLDNAAQIDFGEGELDE
jgi:hypothetical protein